MFPKLKIKNKIKKCTDSFENFLETEAHSKLKCRSGKKEIGKSSKFYCKEVSEISNILNEMLNGRNHRCKQKKSTKVGSNKKTVKCRNDGSCSKERSSYCDVWKKNEKISSTDLSLLSGSKTSKSISHDKTEMKFLCPHYAIRLDDEIPLKGFWNRSETSVKLIKQLSAKLKVSPLSTLLVKKKTEKVKSITKGEKYNNKTAKDYNVDVENISTEKVKDVVENKPEEGYDVEDSKHNKIMLLQLGNNKSKTHAQREILMFDKGELKENIYKREDTRQIKEEQLNGREKAKLMTASNDNFAKTEVKDNDILNTHEHNEKEQPKTLDTRSKNSYGPSSLTVREMSDMFYSTAVVFEHFPDVLKQSKLGDLNPPESLIKAVTVLDQITKSLSSAGFQDGISAA